MQNYVKYDNIIDTILTNYSRYSFNIVKMEGRH